MRYWGKVVGMGLVSVGLSGAVWADGAPTEWFKNLSLSGYLQTSYTYNFNRPRPEYAGSAFRTFDNDRHSFNFNALYLNLKKPWDDGFGWNVDLTFGQDARVIKSLPASAGPAAGATDFDVQEAYAVYKAPLGSGLLLTAGKWVTKHGVEVIETPQNPNFSTGYFFNFAEPFTHTGVSAQYTFNKYVNGLIGVTNGWDVVRDNNDAKGLVWQLGVNPADKLAMTFQGTWGAEQPGNNRSKRVSVDNVTTLKATDKLTLWAQAIFGQEQDAFANGLTGGRAIDRNQARWWGAGLWVQHQCTSWLTSVLRFEYFNDREGVRVTSGSSSTPQAIKNVTATSKFKLTDAQALRAEYRYDWSNAVVFNSRGTPGRVQRTVSLDWVYTF
ncbi:MAG: porin [Elusimicrobia bacterium]|nr:porin [Elusimicrobiota bacterium]